MLMPIDPITRLCGRKSFVASPQKMSWGGGGKLLKTLPPGLRLPGRLRAASLLGFAALLCLLADGADELVGKKESAQRYPASLLAITEHRSQRCSSHVHAFAANSCALAHQL